MIPDDEMRLQRLKQRVRDMHNIAGALRAALNAMPMGVAILDRAGNHLFANAAVSAIMSNRVEPGGDTLSAVISYDARSAAHQRTYNDPHREMVYRYVDGLCIAFIGVRDVWLSNDHNIFGLTAMEQAVVEELINGRSPREASENLGIKHDTVSKHLKRIFPKAGVNRQADLVRVILTGPAGVQWP